MLISGKLRYIQYCRQLKTYGVTFFLVKEKMKGKNKLVPRLLGFLFVAIYAPFISRTKGKLFVS